MIQRSRMPQVVFARLEVADGISDSPNTLQCAAATGIFGGHNLDFAPEREFAS